MLTRNKLSKTKKEERVLQPDAEMPSTSSKGLSEAGTSSVKKRKLPEKAPCGHAKKRLVEEDDKLQKLPEKAPCGHAKKRLVEEDDKLQKLPEKAPCGHAKKRLEEDDKLQKLPEKAPCGHAKKRLVEEDDKLQKLPEKAPCGHAKKRLVEEDDKLQMMSKVVLTDCCARKQLDKVEENKQSDPLITRKEDKQPSLKEEKQPTFKVQTDRARKRLAKAKEDEQCYTLLRSLIDDHSGLTSISSINLLLPSTFKEDILDLTISCLTTNIRVSVAQNEKFCGIYQDVTKFFRLNDGEFHLMFDGKYITAGDTPKMLGMPNRARIECIPLNRPHSSNNDGTPHEASMSQ